jgi:hypothetical protein
MKRFTALILISAGLLALQCGGNSNPSGSDDHRSVIFSDNFENGLSKWDVFRNGVYDTYDSLRTTTDAFHGGSHSVVSDSNHCGIMKQFTSLVDTGDIYCEFYLMAKAAGQSDFMVSLAKPSGSSGGDSYLYGIGFGSNDSLLCAYFDYTDGTHMVHTKNIASIQADHWFKCVVEINYPAAKITWRVDDVVADTLTLPALMNIQVLKIYRDALGAQGPKQYFADDITMYRPK